MIETPTRIEPCFFEGDIPAVLADLAVEIQREAAHLGRGLHPESAEELAALVRTMNCYYSNLIEGHNTRPADIERALADKELAPEIRPLALEAKAHVRVQERIDNLHRMGKLPSPTSIPFISTVHRAFYEQMPAEFRFLERPDGTKAEIVPGARSEEHTSELQSLMSISYAVFCL